jgi:hypothetical protein
VGAGELEGPAVVFSAAAHAGQAAGPGGGAEAAAVVGDLESDQAALLGDGDGGDVGVVGAVGQGLAGGSQDVVGEGTARNAGPGQASTRLSAGEGRGVDAEHQRSAGRQLFGQQVPQPLLIDVLLGQRAIQRTVTTAEQRRQRQLLPAR